MTCASAHPAQCIFFINYSMLLQIHPHWTLTQLSFCTASFWPRNNRMHFVHDFDFSNQIHLCPRFWFHSTKCIFDPMSPVSKTRSATKVVGVVEEGKLSRPFQMPPDYIRNQIQISSAGKPQMVTWGAIGDHHRIFQLDFVSRDLEIFVLELLGFFAQSNLHRRMCRNNEVEFGASDCFSKGRIGLRCPCLTNDFSVTPISFWSSSAAFEGHLVRQPPIALPGFFSSLNDQWQSLPCNSFGPSNLQFLKIPRDPKKSWLKLQRKTKELIFHSDSSSRFPFSKKHPYCELRKAWRVFFPTFERWTFFNKEEFRFPTDSGRKVQPGFRMSQFPCKSDSLLITMWRLPFQGCLWPVQFCYLQGTVRSRATRTIPFVKNHQASFEPLFVWPNPEDSSKIFKRTPVFVLHKGLSSALDSISVNFIELFLNPFRSRL